MLKNILVATDFSERSVQALDRASLLARAHKAQIHLVHVLDGTEEKMILEAQQEVATNTINTLANDVAEKHGLRCSGTVSTGTPHSTLSKKSLEIGADLIVLGPHSKHLIKDAFIGTFAERLVKSSQLPVLLVNTKATSAYSNAILATDFSVGARRAARISFNLGLTPEGYITPIHVFDPPLDDKGYAESEAEALRHMHAFLQDVNHEAERGLVVPMERPVAELLVQAAKETNSEVIIVGNRGQRGSTTEFLKQVFLGSIAQEVLSFAKQDVLVVPLPSET